MSGLDDLPDDVLDRILTWLIDKTTGIPMSSFAFAVSAARSAGC
jgi:hypothetical protein